MMSDEIPTKRKYELKQRAAEMAETRLRITEAAVELHGTIGPARTTVSSIAERAGVQRHTVYRHFPTDADLFGACSAHYIAANPLPDQAPWRAIADPQRRLARALDDLYAYYERTEPMFSKILRDVELVDALPPVLVPRWAVSGRSRRDARGRLADPRAQTACPGSSAAPCDRLPDMALAHDGRPHHPGRGRRARSGARRGRLRQDGLSSISAGSSDG